MSKRFRAIVISILLLVIYHWSLVTVSAQDFYLNQNPKHEYDPGSTDQKFISALNMIKMFYVDTVNEPKLVEVAISEMLKSLDPHSVYMSKSEVKEANEPLLGNFDGIGVQFNILNDTIVIIQPTPGGPSEKLGIMAGDKIVKIDDVDAVGKKINNTYVMKHLRGEKGTKVKVSIFRKGKKELIDYTIKRDKIPLNSIDATYMMTPSIGYIKLNRFSNTSMNEFNESMKKLRSLGMTNLILDLRDNSGGFLNVAVELADEFLDDNKLIVYTEGNNSPRQDFNSTSEGDFERGKLAVLINESSASASEIVSGAIQDWDRGIVIGRRSYGKGLVQRPFNLPDGSAIRLTTARYHTPTGRCIQKSYKEGVDKYYQDLQIRYKHKEFVNPDSIKLPDSLKYYTPNHRVVYGGGGIMPDIFIPLDTSFYSDYYSNILRKGTLYQFSLQYVEDHREELKNKYKDIKEYANNFNIDKILFDKFLAYSDKAGVKRDEKGLKASEEYIKLNMKSLIARNLWNSDAFYEIFNSTDVTLKKAIDMLQGDALKDMKIQAD
jgi:carboxyl-terminal processing protease